MIKFAHFCVSSFNKDFFVLGSILRRLLRTEKWGWRGRTYIILKLRNNWCKKPRDISYGKIETPCGLGLGMMAKYSCNEGYKLLPKRYKERKCLSVRSSWRWSRGTARCRAGNK